MHQLNGSPSRFTNAYNPAAFPAGAIIEDVYMKLQYEVIEPDCGGMAKLQSRKNPDDYRQPESWNAHSNPRFLLISLPAPKVVIKQGSLF